MIRRLVLAAMATAAVAGCSGGTSADMPSTDAIAPPKAAPGKKGAGMANASINPAANPNAIIGSKAK